MTSARRSAQHTVEGLLEEQDRVIARRQVLRAGMSSDQWRWRLQTGRWQAVLPGVAVAHSGAVTAGQRGWAAVLLAGDEAHLTADAALVELGMVLPVPPTVHVATSMRQVTGQQFLDDPARGVQAHRLRGMARWTHPVHEPRVLRVAPAALHAAAWAGSDRAAEWRIAAVVQQRLARPADLREALAQMPRLPRHQLVGRVLDDVQLGAHAASELDFLRFVRRHRLPAPDRLQRLVRTGSVCYLDAWWERQRVAVELDGAHHRAVGTWDADALRANGVVLAERHDRVLLLRFTTGNLRHDGAEVARQLRAALSG